MLAFQFQNTMSVSSIEKKPPNLESEREQMTITDESTIRKNYSNADLRIVLDRFNPHVSSCMEATSYVHAASYLSGTLRPHDKARSATASGFPYRKITKTLRPPSTSLPAVCTPQHFMKNTVMIASDQDNDTASYRRHREEKTQAHTPFTTQKMIGAQQLRHDNSNLIKLDTKGILEITTNISATLRDYIFHTDLSISDPVQR
ncbi:hypothetical protein CC80DRAFT_551622 [Byssothecium circinans]|uniref:Exosome RNA helicase MTR4-like stalk domain-containing protein n=1 Tax=Byssothecium circinans TaxID=147558 RepID=A0A6A5TMQ9_9PLEO|nr:hypothetical protein CC80DRAFT_551622 [Byssothecium circinans]